VPSKADRRSLSALRFHWDDAYKIGLEDGWWVARALRWKAEPLTADSAKKLLDMMRDDYAEHAAKRAAEGGSL
jgi:hypothetical protein